MSIKVLSAEIASQIAAGEVVERPASVVKELIENALDAGARQIDVRVEGAGRQLIEVSDDGSGIPANELPLAVERHATSKLNQASDLFSINTLGFRGEALASIGSVSRLTLTSATQGAQSGARLVVEGGQFRGSQPVAAPTGTVVRVENLFYNVPARLKFLKSEPNERRLIDQLVTRYALAYPWTRFSLHQEDRPVLHTSGAGNPREILAVLYGVETGRQMLEVISMDGTLEISGFISPTSITRTHRRDIHFFINGRPIQDTSLNTALLRGYYTLLMVGRFPLAVLLLKLPQAEVDVNVHPTKAEVRFRNSDMIFSGVQNAVRRALLSANPVPGLSADPRMGTIRPNLWSTSSRQDWSTRTIDPTWGMHTQDTSGVQTIQTKAEDIKPEGGRDQAQSVLPGGHLPLLRSLGQVANAYIVAEGPDGLYLVDQHAAHERVLFERFLAQKSSGITTQVLLQAVSVEIPPAQARIIMEQLPLLAKIGFHIEPFGPGAFLIRGLPALIAGGDPATLINVLVGNFEEDETPFLGEIEAMLIARICKRVAVKSGQSLSVDEQRALLLGLEACRSPRTCPHGRPTMIHLSIDLLERQFGRRGSR